MSGQAQLDARALERLVAERVLGETGGEPARYARDMAAAWRIVERLEPEAWGFYLETDGPFWQCSFRWSGGEVATGEPVEAVACSARTPAQAICLAALDWLDREAAVAPPAARSA